MTSRSGRWRGWRNQSKPYRNPLSAELADLYIPASKIDSTWRARTWRRSVPVVLHPLLQAARYKGAFGGRGGMKSHHFAEALVMRAVEQPGFRAVCVREVQKSLDQSVKLLLEDKIRAFGLGELFRDLRTHIETPGGGIFLFQGMQDHTAESIKSLEGYDVAWVEEAQTLSDRSLTLLRPTIRKDGSELWFSWNPTNPTDPVDVFFRGGELPPNAVLVRTSYKDNPHLPRVMQEEAEWDQRRDLDKYLHVWGGEHRKASEARVFKNWRVEDFPTPERGCTFLLGLDWGFAVDPQAALRAFFRDERTLCIDHEIFEFGVEVEDSPDWLDGLTCEGNCPPRPAKGQKRPCKRPSHGWARKYEVTADCARPESISHCQRKGYLKMKPSVKGQGSVDEGIEFLKSYDILIHSRCAHLKDELTFYSYKVDKQTGVVLPELVDANNHLIDALRYAVEGKRRNMKRAGLVF